MGIWGELASLGENLGWGGGEDGCHPFASWTQSYGRFIIYLRIPILFSTLPTHTLHHHYTYLVRTLAYICIVLPRVGFLLLLTNTHRRTNITTNSTKTVGKTATIAIA